MSSLTLSIIQADLHWEDKAANLSMFEERIRGIGKTEVIVLPEMFSTGFSMRPSVLAERMDGPTVDWMRRMALEKRVVITGSLIIEEGGNYVNRLIWMLPNGQCGYYDKRHLFAFAGEHEHYTAGTRRLIASVNGWRLNLQVCYDLRFPVWARQQALPDNGPEYDVLVYVANWPERRSHAWKTLLQARAIENQCYVVGVNRVGKDGNDINHSGDSMIVDPMGEVMFTRAHEAFIYTVELDKGQLTDIRGRLPFLRDRDGFSLE
jgi:omega-amidase